MTGKMEEKERADAKLDAVTYMSDELGLHRVENPRHSNRAVSLHLYSPPFQSCQVNLDLKDVRNIMSALVNPPPPDSPSKRTLTKNCLRCLVNPT